MYSNRVLAHINHQSGEEQTLIEHSIAVAEYCKEEGEKLGIPYTMYLVGLLHDTGKVEPSFQSHLINNDKKHVNHSSAGAKYIIDYLPGENYKQTDEDVILKEMMSYVIFSHHGFFDIVKGTEYMIERRYKYDDDPQYDFNGKVLPFINSLEAYTLHKLSVEEIYQIARKEIQTLLYEKINPIVRKNKKKIRESNLEDREKNLVTLNETSFYYHAMIRLMLSILKEGDVFDSANSVTEVKVTRISEEYRQNQWDLGVEHVEKQANFFAKKKNESAINGARTRFSNHLKQKALVKENGVFTLQLPTGSGKTQAALRYAVNNANKFKKKHIFYITAFLSVLEQNAEDIRNTLNLNDKAILEHHSNIVEERVEDDKEDISYLYRQYITDSWDSPVILTTMVQFFNTLFKGKSSNIRRFSQLANSVIIIDEAQSIPPENVYLFNLMMNYLTKVMNATVILCTATQPMFDLAGLRYPLSYDSSPELIELTEVESQIFDRVQAVNLILDQNKGFSSQDLLTEVNSDLNTFNSVLIIMNTKKAVKTIYDDLFSKDDCEVYYLTTNLSSAHRLYRIHKIKKQLEDRSRKIIVVATQLVEAGVDFDFDVTYRSTAGVDSLIQAAGRCNRNGRLDKGLFKVFNYEVENTKSIDGIHKAREATFKAMRENNITEYGQEFDLDILKDTYYKNLFLNNENELGFKFYVDSKERLVQSTQNAANTYEMIDILGYNNFKREIKSDFRTKFLMQDFDLASRAHALIRESTVSVIVHWTNPENSEESSEKLIKQLRQAVSEFNADEVKITMKALQKYTISVHSIQKLDMFVETLDFFGEPIYILFTENYDDEIGLDISELQLLSY